VEEHSNFNFYGFYTEEHVGSSAISITLQVFPLLFYTKGSAMTVLACCYSHALPPKQYVEMRLYQTTLPVSVNWSILQSLSTTRRYHFIALFDTARLEDNSITVSQQGFSYGIITTTHFFSFANFEVFIAVTRKILSFWICSLVHRYPPF
jgi:hypothetical protein